MLDMDDHFELWEPPEGLIDKAKLRGIPRHGIGRAMKVSKEQISALLTALKLFTSGAYDDDLPGMRRLLELVAASLEGLPVRTRLSLPADGQSLPTLEIALDEAASAGPPPRFVERCAVAARPFLSATICLPSKYSS